MQGIYIYVYIICMHYLVALCDVCSVRLEQQGYSLTVISVPYAILYFEKVFLMRECNCGDRGSGYLCVAALGMRDIGGDRGPGYLCGGPWDEGHWWRQGPWVLVWRP